MARSTLINWPPPSCECRRFGSRADGQGTVSSSKTSTSTFDRFTAARLVTGVAVRREDSGW